MSTKRSRPSLRRRKAPRFSIRRAEGSDAEGILDCLRSAFETYRVSYTPEAFEDTLLTPETISARISGMSLFVAIDRSEQIVGTIGCNVVGGKEGHIRGMAVRPSWQGRGVAQRLLEAVETELRKSRCSIASLDTTEPLRRAVAFYEKNGFHFSGKVGDFFGMPLMEYIKDLES